MLTALLLAAATAVTAGSPGTCSAVSASHQTALVELYTSQGCSSCPPADRWLGQLESRYPRSRVVPLSLHVSYWDYIGWKDPYARAEFIARQRELAQAGGSRTVYTPGVFVQAREMPGWSTAGHFDARIRAIVEAPAEARLTVAARVSNSAVTVESMAVAFRSTRDPKLVLALVESGLKTAVNAGENRGETLINHRVVRAWSGPLGLAAAPVQWPLPAAADLSRLSIVAFVQEWTPGGRVLQALDLPLAGC
jgi:hypothetical protein